MRKLFAFVLLLVLGMPSALPLFAAMPGNDDLGLPACCRIHGRHRCAMLAFAPVPAASAKLSAQVLRQMHASIPMCPLRSAMLARAHVDRSLPATASSRICSALVSYPAVHAQTESRWRMARERARGKRGPPIEQRLS